MLDKPSAPAEHRATNVTLPEVKASLFCMLSDMALLSLFNTRSLFSTTACSHEDQTFSQEGMITACYTGNEKVQIHIKH